MFITLLGGCYEKNKVIVIILILSNIIIFYLYIIKASSSMLFLTTLEEDLTPTKGTFWDQQFPPIEDGKLDTFQNVVKPHNQVNFNNSKCYILTGKSENIEVKDFKILITPKHIQLGNGEFKYIGDQSKVDKSTYYNFDVILIEKNNPNKSEVFFSVSGLTVPNINDYNKMGGVTQQKTKMGNIVDYYDIYLVFQYGKVTEQSKIEKIKLILGGNNFE